MIEEIVTINTGNLKRIHVNQHVIKANAKHGYDDPPLTVKANSKNFKAHEVSINGPSTVTYNGDRLTCGARVWIETHAAVDVIIRHEEPEHGSMRGWELGCRCEPCISRYLDVINFDVANAL